MSVHTEKHTMAASPVSMFASLAQYMATIDKLDTDSFVVKTKQANATALNIPIGRGVVFSLQFKKSSKF